MSDIPANNTTNAIITGTGQFSGSLEVNGDMDWWRVDVQQGYRYQFWLSGDGGPNTLGSGLIRLLDSNGKPFSGYSGTSQFSFTASQTATYYLSVADNHYYNNSAEGNYIIRASMDDDVPDSNITTATINGTGVTSGVLGQNGDSDRFRVSLTEGYSYNFRLTGDGGATPLGYAKITIYDANGVQIGSKGKESNLGFRPTTSGTYYLEVSDDGFYNSAPEGNYRIHTDMRDTVRGDGLTTARMIAGQALEGRLDAHGDNDWYRITLKAGEVYRFEAANGSGTEHPSATYVTVYDSNGSKVSGGHSYAFDYSTTAGGTFYVGVSGNVYSSSPIGTFKLKVTSKGRDVNGTAAHEELHGQDNDNRISGGAGNDTLFGNGGNDVLIGGTGNDVLNGGAGQDTAQYTANTATQVNLRLTGFQDTLSSGRDRLISIENVTTAGGNDTITGNGAANVLNGGAGNDLISGQGGNDLLIGGGGKDTLRGGAGNDTLDGGLGNDLMIGGTGVDTVRFSGATNITASLAVTGAQNTGQGTDTIRQINNVSTGSGNDRIIGDGGANRLAGGAGNDLIRGAGGNDALIGGAGRDTLDGGNGHDRLDGGTGNDLLRGEGGNDFLLGGAGDDSLYGAAGADRLSGGTGRDQLWGGAGADTFVFGRNEGWARINDWQDGLDRIEIEGAFYYSLAISKIAVGVQVVHSTWGGGTTTIVIAGAELNQIGETDFIFT